MACKVWCSAGTLGFGCDLLESLLAGSSGHAGGLSDAVCLEWAAGVKKANTALECIRGGVSIEDEEVLVALQVLGP